MWPWRRKRLSCPSCGRDNVLPIAYGLPGQELLKTSARRVKLADKSIGDFRERLLLLFHSFLEDSLLRRDLTAKCIRDSLSLLLQHLIDFAARISGIFCR